MSSLNNPVSFFPNYKSSISKSNDVEYVADCDGFLYGFRGAYGQYLPQASITIDGTNFPLAFASGSGPVAVDGCGSFFIAAGTPYRGQHLNSFIFFPLKR